MSVGLEKIERYCVLTERDNHSVIKREIPGAPVEIYLRDSDRASEVRGYIERVQAIERFCFNMPAPNWAIAHFGLHGAAFIVTAESCNEPVAAQYVVAHGLGDRQGVRFWTTVVLPEFRMIGVASYLTAVSTHITRSWAQFGSTICDTDSSLMGRNVKLQPLIVTANMYHTPGRNKVQLEWAKPEDPFKAFFDSSQVPQLDPNLPVIQSLLRYDLGELPQSFKAKPDSYVWEDIALYPHKYYRHFRLSGWVGSEKMAVLSDAKIRLQAEENSNNSIRLEEEGNLDFQARV